MEHSQGTCSSTCCGKAVYSCAPDVDEDTTLLLSNGHTPWTHHCPETIVAPIAHMEGCYYADRETLGMLEERGQVVFRYATRDGGEQPEANPNGSLNNIAGITNEHGNVLGMMPHPERNAEAQLGDGSGAGVFRSIIHSFLEGTSA